MGINQTDQTALASGQSRATPIRSWVEDGGFSFSSLCCSWLSSSSGKSRPGSCCRAESKQDSLVTSWATGSSSHRPLLVCSLLLLLHVITAENEMCSETGTCSTSPGQGEELSALSSAAVCREAEIFNASNNTHLTACSV